MANVVQKAATDGGLVRTVAGTGQSPAAPGAGLDTLAISGANLPTASTDQAIYENLLALDPSGNPKALTGKVLAAGNADHVPVTGLTGGGWKIPYLGAGASGVELALGASGYLKTNGVSAAPTWDTPSGGGGMVDPYTPPSGTFSVYGDVTADNFHGILDGTASNASACSGNSATADVATYASNLGPSGGPNASLDGGGNLYVPGTVDADDYYTHTEDAPFTPQVALGWVRHMRPTASGQLDHERIPPWARKVGMRTVVDMVKTVDPVTGKTTTTPTPRQVPQDSASLQKLTFLGLKAMQALAQQNDDMAATITLLTARIVALEARVPAVPQLAGTVEEVAQ